MTDAIRPQPGILDIALYEGGKANVAINWPLEDRMAMQVSAMGQTVNAHVDVTDDALVFEIDLPAALSFFEPLVRGAVEEKTQKLLR